ncbi:MAG: peptide chain release factor N(5)-glutamine methyltransferase [Phycisphaerales bacterium]|nr:MAG: peptide chain release factor N(5)-glutamine methyltransferase [Phycisphaerales bacterium]
MAENSQSGEAWTIRRLLDSTRSWLSERGVEEPRLSAELLLAHVLGCRRIDLYMSLDEEPGEEQTAQFRELVRAAGKLKPVAYLIEVKEFYSLDFEVTPDVLIPRPETEALVSRAIGLIRASGADRYRVLELGTGSGCIAVAVARYAQAAHVVATDISAAALRVAARNVERHAVSDRVRLVEADGLTLPAEVVPEGGFDLLLSNPPYVAEAEAHQLAENVRRYEPKVALLAGRDGLRFHKMMAREGARLLVRTGTVLTEIGAGQEAAVQHVFARAGGWKYAGTYRDPADPHPRVLEFRRAAV